MNKQIIKSIIGAKQEEIRGLKLLHRDHQYEDNSCYVLIGIRRAGKSYTLYQDILNHISCGKAKVEDVLYVNFEDERMASITSAELGDVLTAYQEMYDQRHPLIYLDEIQNVTGWEKFARRLSESKYRVMITGSNARMLSKEIASSPRFLMVSIS